MARASRFRKKEAPATIQERIYRVALYVRLSVLDSGKKDSDTAETQEKLLRGFIEGKPQFMLVSVYIDNGETGVNFQRDEFEQLMEDVKSGKVNCIIVKDLSRFGRNYIEAGEYLEKVFPFLGVRFIAINDGYDSLAPSASESLSLHLKNLVNDVYARDISAKIAPVLRGKQERGEFIGAWASYGYLKSPEDKHKLIVDPETAPIVQSIYELRTQGFSYQNITRRLTEKNIPSPSQYRYQKGIMKQQRFAEAGWKISTVKTILSNEVYLGHMVQGRKRESLFQGQKQAVLPKEEWIIVKDTHEAIIDQHTFDTVQMLNQQRTEEYQAKLERFAEVENTENILKGLVYCSCCGTKLVRYKNVRENKYKEPKFHVWYSYICPVHIADPTQCSFVSIPEKTVLEVVAELVNQRILATVDLDRITKKLVQKPAQQTEKMRLEQQMAQAEAALRKTARHRESLYDDYADHLMNEHDYIYAQERYKEQEAKLKEQLLDLNRSYQSLCRQQDVRQSWRSDFLNYQDQLVLTRNMALALIEKITLYENNRMEIVFRFEDDFKQELSHLSETEVAHE